MDNCEGEFVQVIGTNPESVNQHPLLNIMLLEMEGLKQGYLDTKYGQIILLNDEAIACKNEAEIIGILGIFEIECKEGQRGKCPYRNYYINVEEWNCR